MTTKSAVPDVLGPGLDVVFCGINPGRVSAAAGAHFANPRNDFWRLLHDDTPDTADLPIACEIHRWWGLPLERPARPHLQRWYDGMLALPAARGVLDLTLS